MMGAAGLLKRKWHQVVPAQERRATRRTIPSFASTRTRARGLTAKAKKPINI